LNGYDGAAMSAFANLLVLVVGLDLEASRMAEGHREASLMAVLCVVTLDFAGGTGHRWTVGRFVTSHA
jgi:hypothetical protein